jgi:signal peptidase I
MSDTEGEDLGSAPAGVTGTAVGSSVPSTPPASPPFPPSGPASPPPPGSRQHGADPGPPRSSHVRSLVEWVVIIAVALIGALVIRTVLFQAFFIPSASMTPTLKVHDRILVNKLSYHVHPVHRGDIVVFKRSPGMVAEGNIKDLVKRVIGLPGDTIQTSDGHIVVDGRVLPESYLPAGTPPGPAIASAPGCLPGPATSCIIPAGHYFVMGDNRDDSSDSRVFGPIDKSQIVGRAFVLIWPLPDFGLL